MPSLQTPVQSLPFHGARTIVVKLGSAVLTTADGEIDQPILAQLADEIATHIRAGMKIILVTSGAVAAGRRALAITERGPSISVRQAMAAVGQSRLMQLYSLLFAEHNIVVAQILLSRSDMDDRRRYLNARNTLDELLKRSCLPIINENDTVTIDELKFGDNDGLAALVAVKMQADALILLSDVDGLYDKNPKTDPAARRLDRVEKITREIVDATSGDAISTVGTGGMATKVHAAQLACQAGVATAIAAGKQPGILTNILTGAFPGTYFVPCAQKSQRRKGWIVTGKTHGRRLIVDDGARHALFQGKKSLLPAGVREVTGEFQAHDLVEIVDATQQTIGRGISNYSSQEMRLIAGKKTAQIETILGAKLYDEAIHRDNLILEINE